MTHQEQTNNVKNIKCRSLKDYGYFCTAFHKILNIMFNQSGELLTLMQTL